MRSSARTLLISLLTVLLALAGAAVAVPASATQGYCGLSWGSAVKNVGLGSQAHLLTARAGRHECWDRVVFEVSGDAGGFWVGYVDQVHLDGSGDVLPVPGGARLQVMVHNRAYDDAGNQTYDRRPVDVTGFQTLRSVVYGNSFEGDSTFGIGVRARLPFRVFTFDGPGNHDRIVIDVAHRWQ